MAATGALFYKITDGIRVTVRPVYLPEQSIPEQQQFVFAYYVRIENVGTQSAQLLSRRWRIHDSIGEDTEVAGDGVVGEQPLLIPGGVHQYQSFCVLKSRRLHSIRRRDSALYARRRRVARSVELNRAAAPSRPEALPRRA